MHQILATSIRLSGADNTKVSHKPEPILKGSKCDCNYADNYYGDRICKSKV